MAEIGNNLSFFWINDSVTKTDKLYPTLKNVNKKRLDSNNISHLDTWHILSTTNTSFTFADDLVIITNIY